MLCGYVLKRLVGQHVGVGLVWLVRGTSLGGREPSVCVLKVSVGFIMEVSMCRFHCEGFIVKVSL